MRSADSRKRLESIIEGLQRKRFEFLFLRGASLTALASISALGAVCLLSFISSNSYYYLALKLLAVSIFALASYRFIFIPLVKKKDSDEILRELDNSSPGLGEATLNASELNASAGDRTRLRGTSESLASAYITEVAAKLASVDISSIFPVRSLKRYAPPLIGAAIITSTLLIFAPPNFLSYLFSAEINPSASPRALKLADIEIKLTYPGYTGMTPESIKGSTGDIKALKGTRVRFEGKPLGPFKSGSLVTESGASYPVNKIDGKISAEFTVLESGSYEIVEADGRRTDKIKITVVNDKEPAVSITSSQGNEIDAGTDGRVEIFYESEDDFGLSELKLTWETEAGRQGKLIGKPEEAPRSYKDLYTFDLAGVDPGKGETVKLRVEAYDNDTVSGPKPGISNAITVKLTDARQKHRELMNYTELLMEELIDLLADEIEVSTSFPNSVSSHDGESGKGSAQKPLSLDSLNLEELLDTQHRLTTAIENASVILNKALQTMMDDDYSEYAFFVGLSNMDMRIDQLIEQRRELLGSFATVDLPRLGRLMHREITEFEDDILFLDSMIKGEKLRDSLLSGKEMLDRYAELSELMKELNTTQDENLKAEIRQKLDELRRLMSELAQKMSAMSGEIQEGFLNRDAFKSMDMQQKLSEIMDQIENGNTEQAMRMLSELQDSMRNMMASLESGLQSFTMSSMSEDMSKVSELLSRIEGLEREEASLKGRTENLKETFLENPGTTGDNIRAFIDKQKVKVAEIKKNLSRAKSTVSEQDMREDTPDGSYLLDNLIKKTDELKNWLDAMDIKESRKIARNLEETSRGLVELGDAGVGNLRKSRREIANSAELAGEIREDLDRFIRSGENEPQSEEIARRQEDIREETGELSGDTESLAGEILLSPGIGEKISEAEGHMGKASESLDGNELSKAISNQDEAIKSLRQAREEAEGLLQEMQASARGSGSPVPMIIGQKQRSSGTRGVDTRYMEIPAARESEIGKEFKERILEAMKGGSPEGYSELNRKYYDRIIK
ncbi:MAG: DUF4175 family protein [Deltaproteobacteria bacterium]